MNKLMNLVNVIENNEECVILEVNCKSIELIKLGCFTGDEIMFRLTKGYNHICTVWYADGNNFSWQWGPNGDTMVSEQVRKMGKTIQSCIKDDFKIDMKDRR